MKKVLIIDDNLSVRNVLRGILTMDGYIVDTASDGEEGLKKLREGNYSIAILDHDLPKFNGLELYMKVCEEGLPIKDSIIFYTGNACSDLHKFLEKVKVPYLIKPASLSRLREHVEAYCNEG